MCCQLSTCAQIRLLLTRRTHIVTAAIKEACGTNKLKIREIDNTLGDLGVAAQLCCQTQKLFAPPTSLLIRRVYSVLHEIR
ncbi:hypothetical protein Lser_V15G17186 [Lactuca serriola]